MYEGFLTALRTPLACEERQFMSAKTPTPISYASRRVRTTLIQLTLNPAVFVIRPDAESAAGTGSPPHDVLELVTQYGNVAVDLQNAAAQATGQSEDECPADPLQFFLSGGHIDHQPYADNCRLAWLCNDYRTDPRDRDMILAALTSARQLTLTEAARECRFATDPISAVLSLVCADFAVADLKSAPIGFKTRISIRRRKGLFA
ncbi:MAG: hypothetical protein AB1490_11995 [Pseudomonadota bacterium]